MKGGLANRGVAFEELLGLHHARYERQGAYVQRNPTPYKVLRQGPGGLICVPLADAPPDFLVAVGGLAILLEAKSHAGDKLPLAQLEPHQADALDAWGRQGEIFVAGVVIRLDTGCWWVRWKGPLAEAWQRHYDGKAKRGQCSLDAVWLKKHAHVATGGDWLPCVTGSRP